jgi:hypothetical protein
MSKQVCEYRVICKDMFGINADIDEKVNKLIKDGWQPLGNAIPFLSESGSSFLVQTLVKYSDKENDIMCKINAKSIDFDFDIRNKLYLPNDQKAEKEVK